MRSFCLISSIAMAALAGCGPKKLALPADPIDRAATCAAVSAANARETATSIKGNLDYAAQTRIIHYAMLAASEGKSFDAGKASAVVARMGAVADDVTSGQWQALKPECDAAYPAANKTDAISLPAKTFDAQLGCYELSDFLTRSVQSTGPEAEKRRNDYSDLRRKLDPKIGRTLNAGGTASYEKTQAIKNEALVGMTKLGSPASVMKLCTDRFN